MRSKFRLFRGILLIAGTAIGGGMLALPIQTGLSGFVPSLLIYLCCWLLMASTGLLFLEVNLWLKGETNIVSMAEKTLGKPGKFCAWGLYLFLFYLLTLAYIAGCGELIEQLFPHIIPQGWGPLFFVAFFAPFVYGGARVVSRINFLLMIGLLTFYLFFVSVGVSEIQMSNLERAEWPLMFMGLPIAFTAFAYQGTVPTLIHYLDDDVRQSRLAILIGSFIPLLAYIIWQAVILGVVPLEGQGGLIEAYQQGDNAIHPLRYHIGSPKVYAFGKYFAFFAMVTSFFGVTIGLLDFLSDGLSIKKTAKGRLYLCLLVFLVPLSIAYVKPGIFISALSYAGGFGCALLLGLLPILMVWRGRYSQKNKGPYTFAGGRPLLVGLACFVLFEVLCQLLLTLEILPLP